MNNILKLYLKLINILVNNQNTDCEDEFRGLLNEYLLLCSEKLEIPDFLESLTYLSNFVQQKVITHQDTNEEYVFGFFATRTTQNNKGTDVIYYKNKINENIRFTSNQSKITFSKSVKGLLEKFRPASNYMSIILIIAIKAEELCYTGKGFPRNGQKSFMDYYSEDLDKRYGF